MSIEGVDYADSRPTPAALVAAGKRFACRYGGPGRDSKQIDALEARALLAAGISIVANAEGMEDGFVTYAAGVDWARQADAHFRGIGMPIGLPIYFSVDFDAGSANWSGIDAAIRGAASVIGPSRVGIYGGYRTVAHCHQAGVAWLWQTYAWSGGLWHPAAQIQQYRNGVIIGGADCDLNRAMVADYGQWKADDMQLSDKLSSGVTVDGALVTLMARTNYLANVLGLAGRLDAILAAAQDDGDTTVVLDPAALAELAAVREAVAAVPQATADIVHADLAD